MVQEQSKFAIVGMAGRFPGAHDPQELWRHLLAGRELIARFDEEMLLAAGVPPSLLANPNYVRARPILGTADLFDAGFFGLTPREAEITDPQIRLLLECGYEALEQAGCAGRESDLTVGVYAGLRLSRYLEEHLLPDPDVVASVGHDYLTMINRKDSAATLLAFRLDLTGPAVSVNTACSTSLVAVHLACGALQNFECDVALAGGSALPAFGPEGYLHVPGGILSPDGHCRAFDARAQGTVDGCGTAMVALKRLGDAIADGDEVHAVILGSGINNDGARKIGYSAPSVDGQARLISEVMAVADVDPATIGYVEAHGTGTPLGDPIELDALNRAYRSGTDARGYCAIGSVKTNLGHLGAAAGVTGLIKAAMAVSAGRVPPSLNYERPNPEIDFADSPFFVAGRTLDWPVGGVPRAAVSSFGIGGTNAHVVIEQAPARPASSSPRRRHPLPVSGKDAHAADEALERLRDHLAAFPEQEPVDVAHTLSTARAHFAHRRFAVLGPGGQVVTAPRPAGPAPQTPPRLVYMFTGQGSQRPGMARDLLAHEPSFRSAFEECAGLLAAHHSLDLMDLLYGQDGDEAGSRLHSTQYAQPALFVVEYALARMWQDWNIRPNAMIGHSLGEYVAACLAGVFDVSEALDLIVARGQVMQAAEPGAMLAVALPEADLLDLLGGRCDLAAVNGPRAGVAAGTMPDIEALERRCAEGGVPTRRLRTSHAFHSRMMDSALDAFRAAVERTRPKAPGIPFLSNVTGDWITPAEATSVDYWVRHLRSTVRFADGLARIAGPDTVAVEIGPAPVLADLARAAGGERTGMAIVPTLDPRGVIADDDGAVMLALGRLWSLGCPVDWESVERGTRAKRVRLPGYTFQRSRYWIERPSSLRERRPAAPAEGLILAWRQVPPKPAESSSGRLIVLAPAGSQPLPGVERLGPTIVSPVNPNDPAALEALFETLRPLGQDDQIVYAPQPEASADERVAALLAAVEGGRGAGTWTILTREGLPFPDRSAPRDPVGRAMLAILGRLAPESFVRRIDFALGTTAAEMSEAIRRIDRSAAFTAWRAGRRWVLTEEPTAGGPIPAGETAVAVPAMATATTVEAAAGICTALGAAGPTRIGDDGNHAFAPGMSAVVVVTGGMDIPGGTQATVRRLTALAEAAEAHGVHHFAAVMTGAGPAVAMLGDLLASAWIDTRRTVVHVETPDGRTGTTDWADIARIVRIPCHAFIPSEDTTVTVPAPTTDTTDTTDESTFTDIERQIAETWRSALGIETVDRLDNFFELGGNSLLALQIVSQVNNAFSTSAKPADLIANPTVAGLADLVTAEIVGSAGEAELDALIAELEASGNEALLDGIERN